MRPFFLISALVLTFAPTEGKGQAVDRVKGWQSDIDSLIDRIDHHHPNPWAHRPRADVLREAMALRDSIAVLPDEKILTSVMRVVASLGDGHTGVTDVGRIASAFWFPVRFTWFADGLWVTAISPEYANAAGKRVVAINGRLVDDVIARWLGVSQGDNIFNRRQHSPALSNGAILSGLGILPRPDTLRFEVLESNGGRQSIVLHAEKGSGSLEFYQWGEMFGPADTKLTTAFALAPDAYLKPEYNAKLPLHLRGRLAYWWTWVPESRALYFQLNAMAAKSRHSKSTLLEAWSNALAFADSQSRVDRFMLDLRYNSGGDGSLIIPLMRALIKRDTTLARPGQLFVITSGKTFSSAAGFVMELRKYTEPVLVGEPPGAGPNASGDAGHLTLPYSGIVLSVSTRYTQTAPPADTSGLINVNVPVQMSGADYFRGTDPALEAILAEPAPYPNVLNVLRTAGAAAATSLWAKLRARYGAIAWWEPWRWQDLNALSYELLEAGRTDDAIAGFVINTERNPKLWETWDSLGEAYLKAKKTDAALRSYEHALQIDPHNWNAGEEQRIVAEIRARKIR